MDSLPLEILTLIFEYLPLIERIRLERVCRKWRKTSRGTWRSFQKVCIIRPNDFVYYRKFHGCVKERDLIMAEDKILYVGTLSSRPIKTVLSRIGPYLKTFNFNYRDCNEDAADIMTILAKYCHNIEILEFPSLRYCMREPLLNLFEVNEKMHSFECRLLTHCPEVIPMRNWKSLRVLSYRDDYYDSRAKVIQLLDNSDSLEELETNDWSSDMMEALLKHENLKILHITPLKRDFQLIYEITKLKNLTSLILNTGFLDSHQDANVLSILSSVLKNLKKLVLYAPNISMEVLKQICDYQNLEIFGLHSVGLTDGTLTKLISHRNLVIGANVCSTDDGFLELIRKLKYLEKLDIVETDVTIGMFQRLVNEIAERDKLLEVRVHCGVYRRVLEICKGSRIKIVQEL